MSDQVLVPWSGTESLTSIVSDNSNAKIIFQWSQYIRTFKSICPSTLSQCWTYCRVIWIIVTSPSN